MRILNWTLCVALCIVIVCVSLPGAAEAASVTSYTDAGCTQNPSTVSNVPSDGSCQNNNGASTKVACAGNAVTLQAWIAPSCPGTPILSGAGVGDGNTCIALTSGGVAQSWVKVNCNSAFLTASLSLFSILLAIFLALFLQ